MLSRMEEPGAASDERIKTPKDGREVKFKYGELRDDEALITVQAEGKVGYSIRIQRREKPG